VITVQPGELTLGMKRIFRAPASTVFRACTEPEELAKWWGPRGFTTPTIEIDLRVGGRYRFAMQPPEGNLFHLTGEFRGVASRKLVSQLSVVGVAYATCSSFPVVGSVAVSSAIEASLR
jgi:uncharacterized protein YndB with AHSA1/START domain